MQTFAGDRVSFAIEGSLKAKLDELVRALNSTTYTVLLAGYSILLSKLSRQEDIIIGSPVVGRTHPDIQSVIGMFVNTLALRTRPSGHQTAAEFASNVHQLVLEANEHQLYPFEELVDQVQTVRDTSRHPILTWYSQWKMRIFVIYQWTGFTLFHSHSKRILPNLI